MSEDQISFGSSGWDKEQTLITEVALPLGDMHRMQHGPWLSNGTLTQPHVTRMAGGQHIPSSPLAAVRCAESHHNHTWTERETQQWAEVYNTEHFSQVIVKQGKNRV